MPESQFFQQASLLQPTNGNHQAQFEQILHQIGHTLEESEALSLLFETSVQELDQPMRAVMCWSQLLLSETDPDTPLATGLGIIVKEVSIKDEVWDTIQNYLFIIERLKIEIRHAAEEGANVTKAQYYLDLAIDKVNQAIGYYDLEDYEKAKSELVIAKQHLERCVLELALARAELYRILLPAYAPWLVLIVIILGIITFLLLIITRRRKLCHLMLKQLQQ